MQEQFIHIADAINNLIPDFQPNQDTIATGFDDFDRTIGLRRGEVSVFTTIPYIGALTLFNRMAVESAIYTNLPTLFLSTVSAPEDLARKYIESKLPANHTDADVQALANLYRTLPFVYRCCYGRDWTSILDTINKAVSEEDAKVIFIDCLNDLINGSKGGLHTVLKYLESVAQSFNVAVVALYRVVHASEVEFPPIPGQYPQSYSDYPRYADIKNCCPTHICVYNDNGIFRLEQMSDDEILQAAVIKL